MKYVIEHPDDGIRVSINTNDCYEFNCNDISGNLINIILCRRSTKMLKDNIEEQLKYKWDDDKKNYIKQKGKSVR